MSTDDLRTGWVTGVITDDWAQVRQQLDGLQACWTDDQGLHITVATSLPTHTPRACTHVWGWSADRLVHVRIDDATLYATELFTGEQPAPAATQVVYRCEASLTFRAAEGESASIRLADDTDPEVLGSPATAYVVVDGPRLVFLRS